MKKLISILTAVLLVIFMMSATVGASQQTSGVFKAKIMGQYSKDMNGAIKFLNDNKGEFKISEANNEFKQKSITDDNLGMRHIKLQQVVDGIPVFGNEYIVHFDKDSNIYAINGNYDNVAKAFKKSKDFISPAKAVEIAKAQVSFDADSLNTALTDNLIPQLYLYNLNDAYVPVYLVRVNFLSPEPGDWNIFVNAYTGDIVNKYNQIEYTATTGTGKGVLGDTKTLNLNYVSSQYQMTDATRAATVSTYTCKNKTSLPGSLVYSTTNVINDPAAVDAHAYAGVVYDFYKAIFGRNGIDNRNMAMKSSVHYSSRYNNAFWNGSQMVYGDGDGVTFIPLSGGLDVIGHEMTHGVDQSTANLNYTYQSGALNESLSDVFGCFVEMYGKPNKSTTDKWNMGEDVYTPGTSGDALRSLANPKLYGQPDNMSGYVNTSSDNGGVHTNSGIPNKAAYLIATNANVGIAKAEQIYYRALTVYLTSSSQFHDERVAVAQAAADLYGAGGAEVTAVNSAFTTVGIN